MRVASIVLGVLGIAALFAAASPLRADGLLEHGNWGVTSAVLTIALVLGVLGGTLEALLALTGLRWPSVCALLGFSLVSFYPFLFFAGRLSASDHQRLSTWLPVTSSAGWLLYLAVSYTLYRLARHGGEQGKRVDPAGPAGPSRRSLGTRTS